MSLLPPAVPDAARIAASTLTDKELAYLVDLLAFVGTRGLPAPIPGWSVPTDKRMWDTWREAAKIRGIQNGTRVVTQTVELRS